MGAAQYQNTTKAFGGLPIGKWEAYKTPSKTLSKTPAKTPSGYAVPSYTPMSINAATAGLAPDSGESPIDSPFLPSVPPTPDDSMDIQDIQPPESATLDCVVEAGVSLFERCSQTGKKFSTDSNVLTMCGFAADGNTGLGKMSKVFDPSLEDMELLDVLT